MATTYKDLVVWQRAMDLVTEIYRSTEAFPKEEIYGLTSQIRRAAVSVPANIAEGQGRLTPGEFRQFLGYARGSLLELETLIVAAGNLNYLDHDTVTSLSSRTSEVGKILNGLVNSLA
ncbi:MAG TPA: four helix bundle protein [Candidatus Limnocylindrales bacterium]|nr:four helix bundle protein [Candidatus Limnocylindrales bacterium]